MPTALLLIAHGSRRTEANADLEFIAAQLRARGRYPIVGVAYLEFAEPTIATGGAQCVAAGATEVILVPYFLSPGVHVVDDLAAARDSLQERFPQVHFALAQPLGRHPLLVEVVEQRANEAAEESPYAPSSGFAHHR
ncbi:MAG: CbiX/SirB N-terminal domain-containing protein [Gemmataceae bacterium]|nr:CbiX/SirB N-terminal domain-containing protein [Gemmata sp.]MDW8198659.1 CbiX/SirB N-terminal domain-containing protein [Gemmataceae bacterium]